MTGNLDPEILRVAEFLQQQIVANPFGSVGVSLTVHGGRVSKIEKTISETLKSGDGRRNAASYNNR